MRLIQTAKTKQSGSALALTMVMSAVALVVLAGTITWAANSARMTRRSIQYSISVSAAEGATEKVLSRLSVDYLSGGEKTVQDNLPSYAKMVPTATESGFWKHWKFSNGNGNGNGNADRTHVLLCAATNYIVMDSAYAGLRGFGSTYTIVSHARQTGILDDVTGGVLQEVQTVSIPIFQFAMYSSGDMEISCGRPFVVTGPVHANRTLYVEPDHLLTFQSGVTAVSGILFKRHPLDTRDGPWGAVVYEHPDQKVAPVSALTLPIGTTNSPEAIRQIIDPPPAGESASSPLGKQRLYNQAQMIITVSGTGITATSGTFNSFATIVPSNQIAGFVTTTNSFKDWRENKMVQAIDIDIKQFKAWSETNTSMRTALWGKDVSSIYVLDQRSLPSGQLGAVRVKNGTALPSEGLTVATPRPLYVLGDYNQTNTANLGTTNTSTTRPAALMCDAITILSTNWSDQNSFKDCWQRVAGCTTVNAAILTGVVETTLGRYSGGMENFPRFMETWGSAVITYNGSMVKMFPSCYATNYCGNNVYTPPTRNWSFDVNFEDPTKLPPLTPRLLKVVRGRWATVAPDKNVAANP